MPDIDTIVRLPEEHFTTIGYLEQGLPAIALVNSGLINFSQRIVFRWHLSVVIHYSEVIDNGMPAQTEHALVDPFEDLLSERICSPKRRPNALFLARITWNETRKLLYRVHDPELADAILQAIVGRKAYPRDFDYRMNDDPKWNDAKWFLDAVDGGKV